MALRGVRRPSAGFTINGWKLRWPSRSGERPQVPIAELRSGQRFEGRYACLRKDRLTARNGGAYLAVDLRDRTGTLDRARVSRGGSDRPALRERRRGRGPRSPRALSRRSRWRSSTTFAASSPVRSIRASSCRPPTARWRSSRASWSTWRGKSTTRGSAPRSRAGPHGADGGRVSPRPLHPSGAPRLPRRPARAHGVRGHAGRRALPAPSAAGLRPADGRASCSTTSARRESSPTAPSSGSPTRAGCSAISRSGRR